jgi:hypothetical protein
LNLIRLLGNYLLRSKIKIKKVHKPHFELDLLLLEYQ